MMFEVNKRLWEADALEQERFSCLSLSYPLALKTKRRMTCIRTIQTLTAGFIFSSTCFRHEIIPLNSTLNHTAVKLEASAVKSNGDVSDTYSPVSEKEHPSETEQSSSWLRRLNVCDSLIQLQLSPKATWQPGMQFVINCTTATQ